MIDRQSPLRAVIKINPISSMSLWVRPQIKAECRTQTRCHKQKSTCWKWGPGSDVPRSATESGLHCCTQEPSSTLGSSRSKNSILALPAHSAVLSTSCRTAHWTLTITLGRDFIVIATSEMRRQSHRYVKQQLL